MQRRKHVVPPFVRSQFFSGPVGGGWEGDTHGHLVLAMTVSRLPSFEEMSSLGLRQGYIMRVCAPNP